jgi:hypothetical protein
MPVVFVHGVATRPGKRWEEQGRLRRSLLLRFGLRGLVPDLAAVHYDEPPWGPLAAAPRWENASLPAGRYEKFAIGNAADERVAAVLVETGFEPVDNVAPECQLLARARQQAEQERDEEDRTALEEVLDVLVSVAAESMPDSEIDALTEFCVHAAAYAGEDAAPSWLAKVETDVGLVNAFITEVQKWAATEGNEVSESFGLLDNIRDRLREAAGRAGSVGARLTGQTFTLAARGPAHRASALFLGDILVYIDARGSSDVPGPIVEKVAGAIRAASQAREPERDPKLIVIAHSLGGEIVYDILSYFCPDIEVDVLVTVGSQVAFFEELGCFRASATTAPVDPKTPSVPRPANVGRWLNVFDLNDVLGFPAGAVFKDVEDYVYSTGKGALAAHGSYLLLPSFHRRLQKRLQHGW